MSRPHVVNGKIVPGHVEPHGEEAMNLDPKRHPWMTAPETRAVMAALGGEGALRRRRRCATRCCGKPVADIDIATPLTPDEVSKRLTAAGLGAVPTGIEHGTVTAIADGKPFEITTLRRDVDDRWPPRHRRASPTTGPKTRSAATSP